MRADVLIPCPPCGACGRYAKDLIHFMDTLGWVIDTLKHHHRTKPGIAAIIQEVDRRNAQAQATPPEPTKRNKCCHRQRKEQL